MNPPPPPPLPSYNPHTMEANGRYSHSKQESPALILILNVVNAVTQLLLGGVAFSAFSFASIFDMSSGLTQHVYLCVIGYVILMSQAILSFNTHAGWAHNLKYPHKRTIHWVMQIIGSIFAITGSVIRINEVENNFQSAHGITGFVAMLLTILSLIGGILHLIFPAQMNTALYKIVHICLGIVTISVAFISLCLGFSDLYRFILGDANANLSIAITIFALGGIFISASSKILKRFNE